MSNHESGNDEEVGVIFVKKRDAKTVKNALEDEGLLNKDYRIAATTCDVDCLAIPILAPFKADTFSQKLLVVGTGKQGCPYSSAVLGNRQKQQVLQSKQSQWCPLKQALLLGIQSHLHLESGSEEFTKIQSQILNLNNTICPSKLEYLGDDRNLVLPSAAFREKDMEALLPLDCNNVSQFQEDLWSQVAHAYNSPRILRKGGVDPNSRIRQTGYQLLWPPNSTTWITVTEQGIRQSFDVTQVMFSRGNISEKIRYGKHLVQKGDVLLDLYAGIGYYTLPSLLLGQAAYVYACEWNPNALKALKYNVQDNGVQDRVSVIAGDCRKLVLPKVQTAPINRVSLGLLPSSEGGWQIAVQALLGTLLRVPREIGAASTQQPTGGWLHVHGNVPVKERDPWAQWLVRSLYSLLLDEINRQEITHGKDWVVVCHHVEKVKSFAPTVNHYVADVFMGSQAPLSVHPHYVKHQPNALHTLAEDETCFFYNRSTLEFEACPVDISPPSCALSADGVLHQEWMRKVENEQ